MDLTILPVHLRDILEKHELCDSVAILTTSDFVYKEMGLDDNEIHAVKLVASKKHLRPFKTATQCITDMREHWMHITFGCPALDAITRNGIPTRGITEICGESGTGKSQMCLQLALTVQLAEELGGLGKGAAIICTEDAFPSKRLYQMAETFRERFGTIARANDFLDNIYIEHIISTEDLITCISTKLDRLMANHPIGLVIIDSVGAVFRLETDAIARADNMRRFALDLQRLNSVYGCGIICVNQVTSIIDRDNANNNLMMPCLGLAWSNCVTTRFQIQRTSKRLICKTVDDADGQQIEYTLAIRKFHVIHSPNLPSVSTEFIISPEGVIDVPNLCRQ